MVRRTGIRDAPSRPREVQVTRDFREVRKAFPEKTPVFLRVSQATTPHFSPKTQKFYLFVKDPQVKLCIFAVAPLAGAWIEIPTRARVSGRRSVAPLAGAWIEMLVLGTTVATFSVAPLAGAWIEIGNAAG